MQQPCQTTNFMKKGVLFLLFAIFSIASYAHTVDSYTATCQAGPQYSVQPNVSSVNNNSNYAWQFYNGATWVCIVNGNNTINGNTYNVTGATYTATVNPGPIVFTNPNNSLHGVQIRCLISDGANPCSMPAGNTWTSNTPHTISVNGTSCSCSNVTDAGSIGYDETYCGVSFDPSNIVSIALPTGGNGTIEYVWLISYDGGVNNTVIPGATGSSYNPGVITQTTWYRRCSRRAGCTDYVGESNWVMKEVTNCCQNVVDGGTIGYNENVCAASFDPANIVNVTLPSGGTGTLEYVWLISTDGGSTYTVIPGAVSASYDPGVITQTTWYRRCARRAGCAGYVGESNWIEKSLCPIPSVNAGPDKNLNCAITSATIGTAEVAGLTYSWSPALGLNASNIAQPIASPAVTTTYTVTVTNACNCTATDVVIVNVNTTPPAADAGPDKNLNCLTTSSTIGTAAVAGNSYSWSPASGLNNTAIAQPTASPSTTTTYTVTVTAANGCTASDVVVVNVNNAPPTANAGPDKNLNCLTTSTTIGTVAIVGNTYSWSPASGLNNTALAQPTATPSTTTSYTVTVTGANGCTASDVVVVNVNTTPPTANAGPDKNLNCDITSAVIGTAAVAGNTYSWSPSTNLSNAAIAQPTTTTAVTRTYTVTVTAANGCTSTDAVVVNVNTTPPTVDAGPDREINCNVSGVSIGTAAIAGNTYSWLPTTGLVSPTSAMPTVIIASTLTYTVTVTGANGCAATDVVTVNVNTTPPTADAGPDKNLNCSITSAVIGTAAIAGNTYSWSPANNLNNTTIAQPTSNTTSTRTYTVTVTAANGCTATDAVLVNVNTAPPTADAGPDKNLNCTITSSTIGTVAIVGNTYSWSPAAGLNNTTAAQPTATPTSTTTYTLTVTGANGCTATDVVTVNVNTTPPTANAGPDKNLDCSITSAVIGTAAIAGNTYSWSPSTNLNNAAIAQPTTTTAVTRTYTVTVTAANGCTATDAVVVNVNTTPPTADAGPDKNLDCSTTSSTIGTIALAGNSYSWSPALGLNNSTIAQPTASPATTTTYTVTVTGANGCTATDMVTVNVNTTPPTADAGPDKNLNCSITSAMIGTAAIAGNTYSWSPVNDLNASNIAQPTTSTTVTRTYTVTVTGANGCTSTDAVVVNVNIAPPTADAGPDKNLDCSTTSATIGTLALAGNTYSWSPALGLNNTSLAEPTASPASTTTYTVTVTGANGCIATDLVTVNVNTTPPTADAGPDKDLDCSITSAMIGTAAIAGNTYSWSPATDLNATNIAQPTTTTTVTRTYTVTVTGANGCTSTDAVVVNVNIAPPTADAGPDKNLDCSTTSATIGTLALAGNSYSWSPALGLNNTNIAQPTANPASTTTYTVTVTGANGCVATDVVTVNVNTTPPTADAGPDKNLDCSITSAMLGTAAIAGNTYSWSPSADLDNANIAQPTTTTLANRTYTVTVTSANGCTSTDAVAVNVNIAPPTVDAGLDQTIDCNILSVTIGTAAIAGNSYSWNPVLGLNNGAIAQPIASPLVNTNYTVTVTGANGCTATDVVSVTINQVPPTPIITGNMDVCNGSTTTLTVSGAGTYLWSTGATTPSITVGAGTYTVTATDGVCVGTTSAAVLTVQGTIGNYVWNDINLDGIQNESAAAGLNGVTVQLYDAGPDMSANTIDDVLLQTTTTLNDPNQNPGYYNFIVCNSGNYFVKFPSTVEDKVTTISNPAAGTDGNSDINNAGYSPVFNINVNGVGVAKDNNTIDAGYIDLKYIGNYVWNDINKNGIQDNGEAGVAGVTVTLFDNGTSTIASTVTDAYGFYKFAGLYTNTYKIAFSLPAGFVFSPKDAGGNNETDSDPNPSTGVTDAFSYQAGTIDMSFDAGIYLPTPTTAEIGDRVWRDLNKNGAQDASETGIAGVTITLYKNNIPVAYTVSDADGLYFFKDLQPDTYTVGFSLPVGYVFSGKELSGDINTDSNPDVISGRTSPIVLVAGEKNHSIDAGMYPHPGGNFLPASLGNFVWNDINNNGIQDANEAGIQGVVVNLYDSTGVNIVATTITDIFGYYIFNNLKPSSYQVEFTNIPAGFAFVPQDAGADDALDSDADNGTGRSTFVVLAPGEVNTTVDCGLFNQTLPTASLGNHVWFDRDVDGLQEANENGVAGVTVRLYDNANTLLATTITNNDGYYIFNNLNAGNYYVNFSNLPVGYKLTETTVGADNTIDSDPQVANGNTALIALANNEQNLTIDAGIVANDNRITKGSIGDKVWNDINENGIQDAGELGVQGVTVTLYQQNGITVIATKETDPLGNYIFTDLDQGSYVVGFSNLPLGFTFSSKDQGLEDDVDGDADATTGGKTDIILLDEGDINLTIDAGIHQAAGLAGIGNYVWNDINQDGIQNAGEPGIPGVTVKLMDAAGTILANTTTDANGVYQFTGLTPGSYKVQFSNYPAGYQPTLANAGGNSQESLDSDADPVSGITNIVTLLAGEYNQDLDAGIFTLKASLGNYVWEDVDADGVQDANEKGLSGIVVTLYDGLNNIVAYAVTNSVGGYNFVNLEPGDYKVHFSNIPLAGVFSPKDAAGDDTIDSDVDPATGFTAITNLVASEYDPTLDAGVHLPTGAGLGNYVWLDNSTWNIIGIDSVSGNGMQDANEIGVAGVTVTLYDNAGNAIKSTITTQSGAYSFNDLIPGTYSVGFSTLPTFYHSNGLPYTVSFTNGNVGGNDSLDSDADQLGRTGNYTIGLGEYNPTVDGGIILAFPLPALELTAFATLNHANSVKVSWRTVKETNTSLFDVERSEDGKVFTKVATTNAGGETHGETMYSINDDISQLSKKDVIYYRVKLIDIDGQFTYSNVVNVKVIDDAIDATVYPSPFSNYLNLVYTTELEGQINIKVIDMNGKMVADKTADVLAGRNIITLDKLDNLAKGMYSIQIFDIESNVKTYFKVLKD